MKIPKNILILTTVFILCSLLVVPALAMEITGTMSSGMQTGVAGTVNNCNPLTIANGTIGAYPTCTVTCNSGYTLTGGVCVVSSGGGGGGGGGGATLLSIPVTPTCDKFSMGDADRDCTIGILDYNILMVNWGKTEVNNTADFNSSGTVDIIDYNILMVNWGK